jgi:hypothetical protein
MSPTSIARSSPSATNELGQSRYGVASTLDKYWEQKKPKDEALESAKKDFMHINQLKSFHKQVDHSVQQKNAAPGA